MKKKYIDHDIKERMEPSGVLLFSDKRNKKNSTTDEKIVDRLIKNPQKAKNVFKPVY